MISSNKQTFGTPKTILVALFQGIGDSVLATPALWHIRNSFPKTKITLTGYQGIEILSAESCVDEILPMPSKARLLSAVGLACTWNYLRTLRGRRFDLLINLTTPLTPLTLAKCSIFNFLCGASFVLGSRFDDCLVFTWRVMAVSYRHQEHEYLQKFRLLRGFQPPGSLSPPSLRTCSESPTLKNLLPEERRHPLIGIAIGGANPSRRWAPLKFANCIRLIQKSIRADFCLLGNEADSADAKKIQTVLDTKVFDLTGRTPISLLPGVISKCDVVLANDSGLMHVAAAVGTPVVAIMGPESPKRYSPISPAHLKVELYRTAKCSPCLRRHCDTQECLAWLTPEHVASAVESLLKTSVIRLNSRLTHHESFPDSDRE